LLFLEEIVKFQLNPPNLADHAKKIYNEFLKVNSQYEINVKRESVIAVEKFIEKGEVWPTIFDELKAQILFLISGPIMRFFRSEEFLKSIEMKKRIEMESKKETIQMVAPKETLPEKPQHKLKSTATRVRDWFKGKREDSDESRTEITVQDDVRTSNRSSIHEKQ
jgi:hypothetical protein